MRHSDLAIEGKAREEGGKIALRVAGDPGRRYPENNNQFLTA